MTKLNYTESDIEQARVAGQMSEREQIIKLLATRNQNKTHSETRYCGLCEAIELIKGEQ
jgi:hypothetical protein